MNIEHSILTLADVHIFFGVVEKLYVTWISPCQYVKKIEKQVGNLFEDTECGRLSAFS